MWRGKHSLAVLRDRSHPEHSSLSAQESRKDDVALVYREGRESSTPSCRQSPSLQMWTINMFAQTNPPGLHNPLELLRGAFTRARGARRNANFRNRTNTQEFLLSEMLAAQCPVAHVVDRYGGAHQKSQS